MADYLLLYSGGSMPETEEEQKAVMDAWTSWMGTLGDGLKDPGNPFSGASSKVEPGGSVGDTAVFPEASGYSVIVADSLEAATELAKGCPVLVGGGTVSVHETFEVM